jgi:hydrogenase expression/formation protein HypC
MCLAVPGRIIAIDESNPEKKMAKVDFSGLLKDVCIQWIEQPEVGDYVLTHVGFALNKIDQKEAEETLRIIKEMGNI